MASTADTNLLLMVSFTSCGGSPLFSVEPVDSDSSHVQAVAGVIGDQVGRAVVGRAGGGRFIRSLGSLASVGSAGSVGNRASTVAGGRQIKLARCQAGTETRIGAVSSVLTTPISGKMHERREEMPMLSHAAVIRGP